MALLLTLALILVAWVLRIGLDPEVAAALAGGLLRQGAGIDVDHCGTHPLGNLHKLVGWNGGVDDLEGGRIGARVLLLLSAHTVSSKGTGHNGGRECGKQDKC